jgi:UMF1 family MFS transporter
MTRSTSTEVGAWTSPYQASGWISPLYIAEHEEDTSEGNETASVRSPQQQKEDDEVLGWTLDAAARGVVVMGTAVFVSSELLKLAKEAAGCGTTIEGETWVETGCTNRVYGFKPSSVLTNIVMIVGLCSAVVMPFIGSIIDHTNHRRAVGSISAVVMAIMILLQMLVLEKFWFLAAILQIFIAFSYTVHLCAVYAYLPELTSNHETLVQYAAQFSAAQYSGSVIFLVFMVGVLSWINRDDQFNAATLSQSVVLVVVAIFFGYAWTKLFRPRPASQQVPPGKTLISAGFWKIFKTSRWILLHHAAIKWFLVSAAFTEAATTTFSTIAITYMTEQLGFDARENGIAILILLLFGVPGTRLAAWLTSGFNPIRSLQACLLVWIINTTAAAMYLKEPDQQGAAYVFAMIWGLAIGWVYPTEKALYITIIPRGQEAELMGTYICACQFLSWLPPLVFSVMNEAGISMRIGLFSLTFYFMVSFCILFLVGDYDEAVAHAKAVDEGRRQFAISPTNRDGCVNEAYGCYEDWADDEQHPPQIPRTGNRREMLADYKKPSLLDEEQ